MIGSLSLALTFSLTLPFSSVFAGSGEWDSLGKKYFYHTSTAGKYKTDHVYSGGGDFVFACLIPT